MMMDIIIKHYEVNGRLIVYLDNESIGYLEYKFPDDYGEHRNVEIKYVQVIPTMRRKGIATKLINHFLEYSKDKVWVSLWTGRESEIDKTYGLYEKLGFEQKMIYEDYYEDGVPTRLFTRRNRVT
jgi:ribosomal protein S18 acetylase RimI-like enzyme